MDLFASDAKIGNYVFSEHHIILSSFNFDDSCDMGMSNTISEQFLGSASVPRFLGTSYDSKLTGKFTVMLNACDTDGRYVFTLEECRDFLKRFTGVNGYQKLTLKHDDSWDNYYYNIHINNVSYEKNGKFVVGIGMEFECDSQFAWEEVIITKEIETVGESITIENESDSLYEYTYPITTISDTDDVTNYKLKNTSDDNRESIISSISSGHTIIMDSGLSTIKDSSGSLMSDKFNFKFLRLIPGNNVIEVSHPSSIQFKMLIPRKVGWF